MKRIILAFTKSRYALELDNQFNTPDGMTIDFHGNIILAIPNAHSREGGTWLLKITPDKKVEKYFWLEPHSQTNKVCPHGIVFGSDGHLYVCDDQVIGGNTTHKSQILRVVHQDGKPVREETLVTGLVRPNGIAFANGNIYVMETQFVEEIKGPPVESGLFCFSLNEFRDLHRPIQVASNGNDRHCIFKFKTENLDWPIGANGIAASKDGLIYVANFGERQIFELTLDQSRSRVVSSRVCIKGSPMENVDGIRLCPKGYLFFADFAGNTVRAIDPVSEKVVTLEENSADETDERGNLDRVNEICLRGVKLYCSNINLSSDDNNDPPHSLSVLTLEGIDFAELLEEQ